MRSFAHEGGAESQEKAPADLNEGIESTLTVASNLIKYAADVETEFGSLPPVTCRRSDLNQVFLNLLVNAAHAIEDVVGTSGDKGRIVVRTRHDDNNVVISITDNGGGIPLDVRERIFDPFFTTKAVGRGSGQGLGIARTIVVEGHNGRLWFESEIGQGTTFFIELPVNGGEESHAA